MNNISIPPQVSVVMSVYNGDKYLVEAIDSILNQTFNNFEFIIINDGSTDKSLEIIQSYHDKRIVIINQENSGLAIALNNCIAIAKSNYIARMDADDISMPERIELQFNYLKKNLQCVAVGSNAEIIDKDGNFIYYSNQCLNWDKIREKILPKITPFFHSSTMYRKDSFYKIGGYPVYVPFGQDSVFFRKMGRIGELRNLKDVLIKYRLVPLSSSRRNKKITKALLPIKKKYLNNVAISKEDLYIIDEAKKLMKNRSNVFKYENYYSLIGKKYLFMKYNSSEARINFFRSLKYRPYNIKTIILIILSFLPKNIIFFFHKKLGSFGFRVDLKTNSHF